MRVLDHANPELIAMLIRSAEINDKDSGYWRQYALDYAQMANAKCRETLEAQLGINLT